MASVTYEHVTKRFGEVTVLENLNFQIGDQEFLVLVGPSGCGKSTALRCLAGLEEVTDGQIWIGDRVVNHLPPKDRDIAMVFQSYALYPHMSVYDNMAFSLKLRKESKRTIDKRVREAAGMLGIDHLLERKPKALSGGQQQRVALGRAIVRNPAVFLMDEPLSNLDAQLRVQTRAEISKLHQRLKTTFLYVTHDQTEAMTMGTRIAVLFGGVLQQLDAPQTLYDKPANTFVAGFIGSPAMNFFDNATIDRSDGELVLRISGIGLLPLPQGKHLDVCIGKRVLFGIRPEHIYDAHYVPHGVNQRVRVQAQVSVIEHMGSDVFVYLERGGKEFIGRFDPRTNANTGKMVDVVVDMEKMHLFDHATKRALI
jgi:multiple sugar transport system ATP-binding protein